MNSTYELINQLFEYLTYLAIMVTGYLVLEAVMNNDDDPDGHA